MTTLTTTLDQLDSIMSNNNTNYIDVMPIVHKHAHTDISTLLDDHANNSAKVLTAIDNVIEQLELQQQAIAKRLKGIR